jgi:hypothetical protein
VIGWKSSSAELGSGSRGTAAEAVFFLLAVLGFELDGFRGIDELPAG